MSLWLRWANNRPTWPITLLAGTQPESESSISANGTVVYAMCCNCLSHINSLLTAEYGHAQGMSWSTSGCGQDGIIARSSHTSGYVQDPKLSIHGIVIHVEPTCLRSSTAV